MSKIHITQPEVQSSPLSHTVYADGQRTGRAGGGIYCTYWNL